MPCHSAKIVKAYHQWPPERTEEWIPRLEADGDGWGSFSPLLGTAYHLAVGVLEGTTPIGILIDRLEECPEEMNSLFEQEIIDRLRLQHPNGV